MLNFTDSLFIFPFLFQLRTPVALWSGATSDSCLGESGLDTRDYVYSRWRIVWQKLIGAKDIQKLQQSDLIGSTDCT